MLLPSNIIVPVAPFIICNNPVCPELLPTSVTVFDNKVILLSDVANIDFGPVSEKTLFKAQTKDQINLKTVGIGIYARSGASTVELSNDIKKRLIEVKKSRTRTTPAEEESTLTKDDIAYTPIGIPLIAGPGAITSIMVLSTSNPSLIYKVCLFLVIILTMLITLFILKASTKITQKIGTSGLRIIQRMMGIILLTISVEK